MPFLQPPPPPVEMGEEAVLDHDSFLSLPLRRMTKRDSGIWPGILPKSDTHGQTIVPGRDGGCKKVSETGKKFPKPLYISEKIRYNRWVRYAEHTK